MSARAPPSVASSRASSRASSLGSRANSLASSRASHRSTAVLARISAAEKSLRQEVDQTAKMEREIEQLQRSLYEQRGNMLLVGVGERGEDGNVPEKARKNPARRRCDETSTYEDHFRSSWFPVDRTSTVNVVRGGVGRRPQVSESKDGAGTGGGTTFIIGTGKPGSGGPSKQKRHGRIISDLVRQTAGYRCAVQSPSMTSIEVDARKTLDYLTRDHENITSHWGH
eukprot:g2172.t1